AILFAIGKYLLGFYLSHSAVASVYGAAGSLAAVLIWVYYSAQILYFGAEFTKVYAESRGADLAPSAGAVSDEDQITAKQAQADLPRTVSSPAVARWAPLEPRRHFRSSNDGQNKSRLTPLLMGFAIGKLLHWPRTKRK